MHYYVIGKGGTVKVDVDITLPDPVMMHDFAITEDYAIFMDFPLTIKEKASGSLTAAVPFRQWPRYGCLATTGSPCMRAGTVHA